MPAIALHQRDSVKKHDLTASALRFFATSFALMRNGWLGFFGSFIIRVSPETVMKLIRLLAFASPATRSFTLRSLRRNWRVMIRCLLVFATLAGCFAGTARAVPYTFTNIADSDGIFAKTDFNSVNGICCGLSINNAGTVAFASTLDDGTSGIFTGNGGPITTIALSSGPTFSSFAITASINDAGTVAFLAGLDAGGEGIFTGNGGPTVPVALTSEPTFNSFGSPEINDAGTVAFTSNLDSGDRGIFTRNGGTTTTIALVSGPTFSSVGSLPSINSAGTVGFRAALESGGSGVFTGNGGPSTTIGGNPYVGVGITPSINDAGTVAYLAGNTPSGGTEIVSGNGGPLTTIASVGGAFSSLGFHPSINDAGTVAFWATLDAGGSGIFTGSDPVADKVIRTEDLLFGSGVTRLNLAMALESPGNVEINDLGQVAFHYELADGRQGIAVATPVPEPGAALNALLGLTVLGLIGRRGHRLVSGRAS